MLPDLRSLFRRVVGGRAPQHKKWQDSKLGLPCTATIIAPMWVVPMAKEGMPYLLGRLEVAAVVAVTALWSFRAWFRRTGVHVKDHGTRLLCARDGVPHVEVNNAISRPRRSVCVAAKGEEFGCAVARPAWPIIYGHVVKVRHACEAGECPECALFSFVSAPPNM